MKALLERQFIRIAFFMDGTTIEIVRFKKYFLLETFHLTSEKHSVMSISGGPLLYGITAVE